MSAVIVAMREEPMPAPVNASGLAEATDRALRQVEEASADRAERSRDLMSLMEGIQARIEGYEDTISKLRLDLAQANSRYEELVAERVVSEMTHFQTLERARKEHAAALENLASAHARALEEAISAHRTEMERFQGESLDAVRRYRERAEQQIALANQENQRLDAQNVRLCEDNRQLAESVSRLVHAIESNVESMRRDDETLGNVVSEVREPKRTVVPFAPPGTC